MRILVTGGCGFIGSHIVDQLIDEGHEVAVIDNLSTGNIKNLNPKAKLFGIDILSDEMKETFAEFKPQVVYHEAAQIDIQKSIKDTPFDAKVNILGTVKVLENCRNYGIDKIIYASSAAVYGNPEYLGIDENHSTKPISFYGISKYTPEYYIKVFSQIYGLKYTILRYANVYGIRQDPKGEGGVVSIFLDKMLKNEQPVIFGDGEQTRDFVYVADIAGANIAALKAGDNEVINISTNTPVSVNMLFKSMKKILNNDIEVLYGEERKGDIIHSYLCNEKAIKTLNWQPKFSLEKGLQKTIAYYSKI